MTRGRVSCVLIVPIVAVGCAAGDSGGTRSAPTVDGGSAYDAGSTFYDAGTSFDVGSVLDAGSVVDSGSIDATEAGDSGPAASNVAPIVVNQGLPGSGSQNVPFVSVKICVPGTTKCQTIDNVILDTGSSGFRTFSSLLSSEMALPQQLATTGNALVECAQFGAGYTWGSVRLADVELGGERAARIPIQIIGDPDFTSVPTDCSSAGPANDTPSAMGANGLLGINPIVADCGDECTGADPIPGAYYSCSGGCTVVGVPAATQVSNPVAFFETDNNGEMLQFPTVPASGAATLTGNLIFGIGTAPNNGLGSAKVLTVDSMGNLTTNFNGKTLSGSYIDSGTPSYTFIDGSIAHCPSSYGGLFCPSSTLSLSAQNQGLNGNTSSVSFSVENGESLVSSSSLTAFDDVAGPGEENSFCWGFPFFIGRSVFVGIDGASTPGGKGPYFAY
jgi:hypothetical protein